MLTKNLQKTRITFKYIGGRYRSCKSKFFKPVFPQSFCVDQFLRGHCGVLQFLFLRFRAINLRTTTRTTTSTGQQHQQQLAPVFFLANSTEKTELRTNRDRSKSRIRKRNYTSVLSLSYLIYLKYFSDWARVSQTRSLRTWSHGIFGLGP